MEVLKRKNTLIIEISTIGLDFDSLFNEISHVPVCFRDHLAAKLSISKETFYHKKRTKSFKPLEQQKLSDITGVKTF